MFIKLVLLIEWIIFTVFFIYAEFQIDKLNGI